MRARRRGPGRGRPRPGVRLVVLAALAVSVFGLLLGRLGQVQVLQPVQPGQPAAFTSAGRAAETHLEQRTLTQPAPRGRILDAQGEALTANTSSLTVTLQRRTLADAPDGGRAVVDRIAAALNRPAQAMWEKTFACGTTGSTPPPACFAGASYEPIPVATQVDPAVALSLLEQPENYPGVALTTDAGRAYPAPRGVNAAHVLGYVDRATSDEPGTAAGGPAAGELVGRDGLEAQYDAVLRGTHATTTVGVDPRGFVTEELAATPAVPGRDVVTHLSAPVQVAAEKALTDAVSGAHSRGFAADSGAAVVLDVTNGGVVAAASYPAYDPSVWVGGISQAHLDALRDPAAGMPLVSRLTGAVMPPASTFKIVSTTAAAAMGVDLGGSYDCPSAVQVGDRTFHNDESQDFGRLTLQRNVEVSCDTVWYRFAADAWTAGGGLGAKTDAGDPFVTAATGFGLGAKTGVDLPGEVAGRVPGRAWKQETWSSTKAQTCSRAANGYPEVAATDPTRAGYLKALAAENCQSGWQYRPGDAVNLSIGQGDVTVTPLQLARAYAAVANGGTLWAPQVAAATQNQDGSDRTPIAPVATGTAPLTPPVRAFLLTTLQGVVTSGTAAPAFVGWPQADYPLAGKTGSAEVFGKQATSWFASFGPATNPRYAVVVMVAQAGTGVGTAAPASRAIWEALRANG